MDQRFVPRGAGKFSAKIHAITSMDHERILSGMTVRTDSIAAKQVAAAREPQQRRALSYSQGKRKLELTIDIGIARVRISGVVDVVPETRFIALPAQTDDPQRRDCITCRSWQRETNAVRILTPVNIDHRIQRPVNKRSIQSEPATRWFDPARVSPIGRNRHTG